MKLSLLAAFCLVLAAAPAMAEWPSVTIGTFPQEVRVVHTAEDGLPSDDVHAVALSSDGAVYAGTANGLARLADGRWSVVAGTEGGPVSAVAVAGNRVCYVQGGALHELRPGGSVGLAPLPEDASVSSIAGTDPLYVATDKGLLAVSDDGTTAVDALNDLLGPEPAVNQVAVGPMVAVAAQAGLFVRGAGDDWERVLPADDQGRSWAPAPVGGVAFDSKGRLWFASLQGVGVLEDGAWTLYEGKDGLPYNEFTMAAAGSDSDVWFGTRIGAIHYDGSHWAYRQGKRWLPDDAVRSVAVDADGNAWFATSAGVGLIERRPMTLWEKAKHYEELIDRYNRRTEYGYVLEARLDAPGDLTSWHNTDSDNDGLWTSMYGAGECYAYAATGDPEAKRRADDAFKALRFLTVAPATGELEQQPGFVARTVIDATEPNPNERSSYTIEGQQRKKDTRDSLWKVYFPRWVKTKDGKYWYKTDTSSDELDGHYFFYAQYYELAAETEAEREAVREVVRNLTNHLIRNGYNLVDHDGKPTRWAMYDPDEVNHDHNWHVERGLNSLSMLSYLTVAEHILGDAKYSDAIRELREVHAYDTNALVSKIQRGIGSGNQSDDEMAFMCFYNLLRYTKDPELRHEITYSFYKTWILEFPEMNPFFNFAYVAVALDEDGAPFEYTNPWGTHELTPWEGWLEDSLDTLKRFPLDRINWRHTNSHRLDMQLLPRQAFEPYEPLKDVESNPRGYRVNGKVIPADECHFNHWNRNPFALDTGGNGTGIADGAVFTLPYYMGLYHGFIRDEAAPGQRM